MAYHQQRRSAAPGYDPQGGEFSNLSSMQPGHNPQSQSSASGTQNKRAVSYQVSGATATGMHQSNMSGGTSAAHQYSAYHRPSSKNQSNASQIYGSTNAVIQHQNAMSAHEL